MKPLYSWQSVTLLIFIVALVSFKTISSGNTTEAPNINPDSEAAFHTMMDVLTHKRCINCHPSDNIPKQGDDSHEHRFGITRNNVTGATNCNTCHQSSNNNYSGVPGAPHWSLAPASMAWEGLNRYEIARVMMDKSKNGNRSTADILHHLTEDKLVLWAWDPGIDNEGNAREIPPASKEDFIMAVKKWIDEGAIIPEEK